MSFVLTNIVLPFIQIKADFNIKQGLVSFIWVGAFDMYSDYINIM